MNQAIHLDQTYCDPKRSIFDNKSLILGFLMSPSCYVALNQEKRFLIELNNFTCGEH